LAQAFLKKWWVESDLKAPNLLLSLRIKGSGCDYNSKRERKLNRQLRIDKPKTQAALSTEHRTKIFKNKKTKNKHLNQ
jgi:hypothetical protein